EPEVDFWILRSLAFSVGTMKDAADADGRMHEELDRLSADLLRFGHRWWERSVVLASRIDRDAVAARAADWLHWPWRHQTSWVRINAALATEHACARGHLEQSIELLRQLWQASATFDPYLAWAIHHVLGVAVHSQHTSTGALAPAAAFRQDVEDRARVQLAHD